MKTLSATAYKHKDYTELSDEAFKPFTEAHKKRAQEKLAKNKFYKMWLEDPDYYKDAIESAEKQALEDTKQDDSVEKDRAWTLALQNEANQFNEYLSSTAYQRAAHDMQAAGINPGVMFAGGAGGAGSAGAVLAQNDKAEQEQEQHEDKMHMQYMQGIFSLLGGIIGGGLSAAGSLGGAAMSNNAMLNSALMHNSTRIHATKLNNTSREAIANARNISLEKIANMKNSQGKKSKYKK